MTIKIRKNWVGNLPNWLIQKSFSKSSRDQFDENSVVDLTSEQNWPRDILLKVLLLPI